jgi:hypothetical protein
MQAIESAVFAVVGKDCGANGKKGKQPSGQGKGWWQADNGTRALS